MAIENFLKNWTIRTSTTSVIAIDDKLSIARDGQTPKIKFRCESPNHATVALWAAVHDCQWFTGGGDAGHLAGTISDPSNDDYPLAITYAEGSPNLIHLEVVRAPAGDGSVIAMGGGDGGGGAGGDDDLN
jgi:hypothetical protein